LQKVINKYHRRRKVVEEIVNFLHHHSHPELFGVVERELGGLIEEHKKHGHAEVISTLGKVYISDQAPPRSDIPDNFLWYVPEKRKVFIRQNDTWKELGFTNPFEVDREVLWAWACAILCAEMFYKEDMIERNIKILSEKLPFINWNLVAQIVTSEEYRKKMVNYMKPKNFFSLDFSDLELEPVEGPDLVDWFYFLAFGAFVPVTPWDTDVPTPTSEEGSSEGEVVIEDKDGYRVVEFSDEDDPIIER